MLQLQRASAGSGKTFTLAKKFIWFLLTVKDPDTGLVRLRTEAEIADGVSGILAITFTNKATAEMKQRIVDKLAALADADNDQLTPKVIAGTDYLDEFSKALNADHREIAKASRMALHALLNQYSDFNVSTIDSFFQTVLRTFAYESNLNDSYQVEIDSDYIASAAIDATLDEVNTAAAGETHSSFWINLLMNDSSSEKGAVWNIFQKSSGDETIYSKLRNSLKKMENEEFKEISGILDSYLDTEKGPERLIEAYNKIRADIETELREAFGKMLSLTIDFEKCLNSCGLDAKEHCARYVDSHLAKIHNFKFDGEEKSWFKPLASGKSVLKKGVNTNREPELSEKADLMYRAFEKWSGLFSTEKHRLWKIYSSTLPYLGLLLEGRNKIAGFLDANNLIQIGDTNSMLNRIIGDSDTPFIYERLGTNLNHYLIDEFQDTSRLQWENLKRLLRESISRGEDNLIIGDAKQSIYRFRNADPSLITGGVTEEFGENVYECGMSKDDNTNWRSSRHIVEFNNYFFQTLTKEIVAIQREACGNTGSSGGSGGIDFDNLYSNVVQYPKKQEETGYVEIRYFNKTDDISYDDDDNDSVQDAALKEVGPLISSLIKRGYKQKEIAVLIDTKKLGNAVIDALIGYNASLIGDNPKIEFISEDSLVISSSEAVRVIVGTLRKITEGNTHKEKKSTTRQDTSTETDRINWRDIRCDFSFFALRHPDLTPSQQIAEFIRNPESVDAIREMLDGMQAVTLPSIVESVVENFVPTDLRRSQAVFIAGFQDLVLDYCERYSSDISSFLEWWDSRGKYLSISSPEDTDAVSIMTIHKSKGLEFKCVILPYEVKGLTPPSKKKEWRWVEPSCLFDGYDLPQRLPVETTKALLDTEYADLYRKYIDMYMMDRLNSLYVAFTRAKCELYIFTKNIDENNKRISRSASSWFLKELCINMDDHLPQDMTDIISPDLRYSDEEGNMISFGQKTDPDPEEQPLKILDSHTDISFLEEKTVEEYGVNSCPSILHCIDTPCSATEETTSDIMQSELEDSATVSPEAADNDPRSEGNLLHAVMERVILAEDVRRSVLNLKMRGIITSSQAREWEPMLMEAVADEEVNDWFSGKWRVLNERSILLRDNRIKRPDRIMISPDGKEAVIVDYKFGELPEDENSDRLLRRYLKQVKDYAFALRASTGIKRISAFVWYVRGRKIYKSI